MRPWLPQAAAGRGAEQLVLEGTGRHRQRPARWQACRRADVSSGARSCGHPSGNLSRLRVCPWLGAGSGQRGF